MSLKQKTISGLLWSFLDRLAGQSITFIVGIILARLLAPEEFGLIGMILVFIAIADSFINSGFSQALIRKKDANETDFSTAFFFNLIVGIFFYWVLFFSAPVISRFFDEPKLILIIRVVAFVLIIDALTIIQRTILTKKIDFKLQTKVSVIAAIFSGIIGISMALGGYGVWSLVAKLISQRAVNSFLLWVWNKWFPLLVFSKKSFSQLFSFGSKLLISGLIDTIYKNIYYVIIGKFFSAQELGFYSRADQFRNLPSQNINTIISRVSFPILSTLQDEPEKLKAGYQKLIGNTMFISFILLIGMAAISDSLIIVLIGEKWRSSIIYLQLLCIVGMLFPLHALNLNILKVKGRSDLFLKIEIIKKILSIPIIITGIFWGIKIMILGMILNSIIAFFINSYYTNKLIQYSRMQQIKDIIPSLFLSAGVGSFIYSMQFILDIKPIFLLLIQITSGIILIIGMAQLFRMKNYLYIKNISFDYLKKFMNERRSKS
ncbi:MAG: MOP flippase family protein [Saprospiraceae bacterium]|nr:MOP flippase family protein [Saprospiraceae bacterium]